MSLLSLEIQIQPRMHVNILNSIVIVAPCILKIHWISHTNKCT